MKQETEDVCMSLIPSLKLRYVELIQLLESDFFQKISEKIDPNKNEEEQADDVRELLNARTQVMINTTVNFHSFEVVQYDCIFHRFVLVQYDRSFHSFVLVQYDCKFP